MLQFLTSGLFQGAVYGLLAVGIVLVYKGTRVFNFAQGEFGTVAAYVLWSLHFHLGVPYGAAFVAGLAAALVLGLVVERAVVRPLFDASRITLLVATVGVALLVIGITVLIGKPEVRNVEPLIPTPRGEEIILFNAAIIWQQILVVVALAAVALLLAFFFSRTNLGLGVLATSQDPFATRVVGIGLPGMSRLIWGMAALLGGLAGLLQAPIGTLQPGFMTTTSLVPAFAAAVLGGMTSLPGAFVGGILVGVAQNLGVFYLADIGFPGASEFTVFALLLLVLMIRPRGILGAET